MRVGGEDGLAQRTVDPQADRESIWSVPAEWRDLYWWLFSAQIILCALLISYYEIVLNTADGAFDTFIVIGRGSSSFVVLAAAETVILVEVISMLSERYLKKRFRDGVAYTLEQQQKRRKRAYELFGFEVNGVQVLPNTPEVERFLQTGETGEV